MSDMNIFLREMLFEACREEQIRRAENARLIHQLRQKPTRRIPIHCRVLLRLGERLVTWGTGLQERFKPNALNAPM
jgi:hypothetical protein